MQTVCPDCRAPIVGRRYLGAVPGGLAFVEVYACLAVHRYGSDAAVLLACSQYNPRSAATGADGALVPKGAPELPPRSPAGAGSEQEPYLGSLDREGRAWLDGAIAAHESHAPGRTTPSGSPVSARVVALERQGVLEPTTSDAVADAVHAARVQCPACDYEELIGAGHDEPPDMRSIPDHVPGCPELNALVVVVRRLTE